MCFFFFLLNLFSVCFVHWGSSWKYFLFLTFIFSIIRIWNCQWQLFRLPTLERKAKAMGRWTVVDCEKRKIDGRWGGENIHTIIPKIDTRGKSGCFFFFFLSLNWISGYLIVFWINWWVQYLIVIRGRQLFMNAIFFSSAFFLILPMVILSSIIFKGWTCVWYLVLLDILRCR